MEDTNESPVKDKTAFGQKSTISDYTVANTQIGSRAQEESAKKNDRAAANFAASDADIVVPGFSVEG